jgi:LPPG:FO 2-phospho-L-lactate transferase
MSRLGVVCGGTGSFKFARAIAANYEKSDGLTFVANVGDNFWYHGLYVCPDVDILTYALSDQLDLCKGWGLSSDTFAVRDRLAALESPTSWFSLGDRDLALSLRRTELIAKGWTLTSVTKRFCDLFKIKIDIIPATDDSVQTFVRTSMGTMHLQEFWVKYRASHAPAGVEYVGIGRAKPSERLLDCLKSRVVICPANPVTSVGPTISLKGVKRAMKKSRVVAVSPFVGSKPVSGPAASLMRSVGLEPNSFGTAKMYSSFLKTLLVDTKEDPSVVTKVKDLGVECVKTNTIISDEESGKRIAKELFDLL